MFSELPQPVVRCLTLILGKFPVIILSNISSLTFSLLLLEFPLLTYYIFSSCTATLEHSGFVFSVFILFAFSVFEFSIVISSSEIQYEARYDSCLQGSLDSIK